MNAFNPRSRMRKGRLFLLSLRVAMGWVPIWASAAAVLSLAALMVALPWSQWFAGLDGHRWLATEEFGSLSTNFRFDHREALAQLSRSTAQTGAVLAFCAWLLGIFVAGGWLQVILERSQSQVMRRFCMGGARHFLRFLRLSLLLLLVLGFFRWLLYERPFDVLILQKMFGLPASDMETAQRMESLASEVTRDRILWVRDGVMAFVFLLTMAWGIFARTRMAVAGSRSALVAFGWTAMSLLRNPLRSLGPLLALLATEALVLVLVLGTLARWTNESLLENPSRGKVIVLLVLGILGLIWREIQRGARYHAAVVVSKATIRSSHHTDPWQSIGGPGGPQYPVNEEDEDRFGVSV